MLRSRSTIKICLFTKNEILNQNSLQINQTTHRVLHDEDMQHLTRDLNLSDIGDQFCDNIIKAVVKFIIIISSSIEKIPSPINEVSYIISFDTLYGSFRLWFYKQISNLFSRFNGEYFFYKVVIIL